MKIVDLINLPGQIKKIKSGWRVNKLIKEKNQDKEPSLTSKIGWKCPFSLDMDKNSTTGEIICENCGTPFKSNKNSNYCLECKELFYDGP